MGEEARRTTGLAIYQAKWAVELRRGKKIGQGRNARAFLFGQGLIQRELHPH